MAIKSDVLRDLQAARDEAKVQIHLMSMEARNRWRELESALEAVEQKVNHGGEKAAEALLGATVNLTQSVREFVKTHSPLRPALGVPVRAIMCPSTRACSPQDTLNQAAQIMWDANCGAVPVVNADGTLAGIITDRDICMAAYTRGEPLWAIAVSSVMTPKPLSCSASDPVERVFDLMSSRQVRRVMVTDEGGRVVGVVSLADLARWAQALRAGREPAFEALAATVAAISQPQREGELRASAAE